MPAKQRRNYARDYEFREIKQRFLIVCEGTETEPRYFRSFKKVFRLSTATIKSVGTSKKTYRVVEEAIKEAKSDEYHQVWCVFDKDDETREDVQKAYWLAKKNNINIAFSNEAFELWFLLHFSNSVGAVSRNKYCERLTKILGVPYEKSADMIYKLIPLQDEAIQRAEVLHAKYSPHDPYNDNPCTTVYLLVRELMKYAD